MTDTQLEAAHRELQELYKRLALTRPLGRQRIDIEMQIARVRRRIAELQRAG